MNRAAKDIATSSAILLGIIGTSFLIVSIPGSSTLQSVSSALSIASPLSSLMTLLIALTLFNKFGIEKDILEKNLDAVSRVFDVLTKTRIFVDTNDGSWHGITLLRDLRKGRLSEFGRYGDKIVVGDASVLGGMEKLSALGESIFMPKEIAICIEKIPAASIIFVKDADKNPQKYALIQFPDAKKMAFPVELGKEVEDKRVGLLNGRELKLAEYLQMFDDLYKSCQKWLKTNSSINLDLNS